MANEAKPDGSQQEMWDALTWWATLGERWDGTPPHLCYIHGAWCRAGAPLPVGALVPADKANAGTSKPHRGAQYVVVRVSAKRWQIAFLNFAQIYTHVSHGGTMVQGVAPQYSLYGHPAMYTTECEAITVCAELNAAVPSKGDTHGR